MGIRHKLSFRETGDIAEFVKRQQAQDVSNQTLERRTGALIQWAYMNMRVYWSFVLVR